MSAWFKKTFDGEMKQGEVKLIVPKPRYLEPSPMCTPVPTFTDRITLSITNRDVLHMKGWAAICASVHQDNHLQTRVEFVRYFFNHWYGECSDEQINEMALAMRKHHSVLYTSTPGTMLMMDINTMEKPLLQWKRISPHIDAQNLHGYYVGLLTFYNTFHASIEEVLKVKEKTKCILIDY